MSASLTDTKHCDQRMIEMTAPKAKITFRYCSKCNKYFTVDGSLILGMPEDKRASLVAVYAAAERILA